MFVEGRPANRSDDLALYLKGNFNIGSHHPKNRAKWHDIQEHSGTILLVSDCDATGSCGK